MSIQLLDKTRKLNRLLKNAESSEISFSEISKVLKEMTFTPFTMGNYTIYKNENRPELGYFIKYAREGYYEFGIGDYTIPNDFTLSFDHNEGDDSKGVVGTAINTPAIVAPLLIAKLKYIDIQAILVRVVGDNLCCNELNL